MRANQLRLWFASMAYVLLGALRRIGLAHTALLAVLCRKAAELDQPGLVRMRRQREFP